MKRGKLAALLVVLQSAVAVAQTTYTFRTGVCCDDDAGTTGCNTTVCTLDSDCAGGKVCAGQSGDDVRVTQNPSSPCNDPWTHNSCDSSTSATLNTQFINFLGVVTYATPLIRWNTASLPDNLSISSASVTLHITGKNDTNNRNFCGDVTTWGGTCTSGDGDPTPACALWSTDITTIPTGTSVTFSVANPSTLVNLTGYTEMQTGISGSCPPLNTQDTVEFAAYDSTADPGPRLEVVGSTHTPTWTDTPTHTYTYTPTSTDTHTPTPTDTSTYTPTHTSTPTPTPTLGTCVQYRLGVCCDNEPGTTGCLPTPCVNDAACSGGKVCAGNGEFSTYTIYKTSDTYPPDGPVNALSNEHFVMRTLDEDIYVVSNGLVTWDTSGLPDSITILNAQTTLYLTIPTTNHDGLSLQGEWYDPLFSSADYTDTPSSTAFSVGLSSLASVTSIPLANPGSVDSISATGMRLHISQLPGNAAPIGFNSIAMHEAGVVQQQQLDLCYITNTPTPTPTLTLTPTSPLLHRPAGRGGRNRGAAAR